MINYYISEFSQISHVISDKLSLDQYSIVFHLTNKEDSYFSVLVYSSPVRVHYLNFLSVGSILDFPFFKKKLFITFLPIPRIRCILG